VRDLAQSPRARRRHLARVRPVLVALGMGDGFTPHGVVPTGGEGRVRPDRLPAPGGAPWSDQMTYPCDIDLFREWRARVCWGGSSAAPPRTYNAASPSSLLSPGPAGLITRIDGLAEFPAPPRPRARPFEQPPGCRRAARRADCKKTLSPTAFLPAHPTGNPHTPPSAMSPPIRPSRVWA